MSHDHCTSGVTYFNVQLWGLPAGSADWIVTDDWSLYLINNNFINTELRVDQAAVYNAASYTNWIYTGSLPSSDVPASFTTGWFAVNLASGSKFTQLGTMTTVYGPKWFVYSKAGISSCLRGHSTYGGFGCEGDYRDLLDVGQWRKFWIYNQGTYWVASIYDQNGVLFNLAHISSSSTRIYRAYISTEEAFNPGLTTDPRLRADFTYYHPQYKSGTTFVEWPASSGGNNNYLYNWPPGICPSKYGAGPYDPGPPPGPAIGGDHRWWHTGNDPGDTECSRSPQF